MRRLATALAVLAVLAAAPAAHAIPVWGDAASRLDPYVQNAERFWAARGARTDCTSIELKWWHWDEEHLAWGGDCTIWVAPDKYHELAVTWRCSMVLHEYGHVLGLGHVYGDPKHIMAPQLSLHPSCYPFARQLIEQQVRLRRHARSLSQP